MRWARSSVLGFILFMGCASDGMSTKDEVGLASEARALTVYTVNPANCASLQTSLDQRAAAGGGEIRLSVAKDLVCATFERAVDGVVQRQPLIVPEGVTLNLNGSRLLLAHVGGSYGVRLSRRSGIRNGKITVQSSVSPGSQSIWHSCISVGAAYGDGGTTAKPNYHSEIYDWAIADMTLSQTKRDGGAVVGIMSAAHHGTITNVTIEDSAVASIGIAMDWGMVGNLTTYSPEMCNNKKKFLAGQVYTTHPHNITITNVRVGRLSRPVDINNRMSVGVRTSACHDVTVDGVTIQQTTFAGANADAGDLGYEFARAADLTRAHKGLEFRNITQHQAGRYGIYVNGLADNVHRAQTSTPCADGTKYVSILDPLPTMGLRFLGGTQRGSKTLASLAGARIDCAKGVVVEGIDVGDFTYGIDLAAGVSNSTVWRSHVAQNLKHGIIVGERPGEIDCPVKLPFNNAISANNVHNNGTYQNGAYPWAGIDVESSSVTDIVGNQLGAQTGPEIQMCGVRKTPAAATVRAQNNVFYAKPSYGSHWCGF